MSRRDPYDALEALASAHAARTAARQAIRDLNRQFDGRGCELETKDRPACFCGPGGLCGYGAMPVERRCGYCRAREPIWQALRRARRNYDDALRVCIGMGRRMAR